MKTILVIEDEKQYREILTHVLTDSGFKVKTAPNGKAGLTVVEKEHVDLILLDLLMPQMDGITFYHTLQEKLKKHIPIIVLTNVSDANAYDTDVKEVIIKANISLDELVAKVKKYTS